MSNRPALLGNSPIFHHKVNIARPVLPSLEEISEELRGILESGVLTKGERLRVFEEMVAEHLGVKHAVAVSSCTSGLMLTCRALGLKGDVVVPSFTFLATASALIWSGLRPVFADVDKESFNLDPCAARAAVTPETRAMVAVHNFGNPAAIEDLQNVADRQGLRLIFDAAHAFGSLHKGRAVGAQGDAQVYSLTPTKLLVAGEGGVVATNSDEVAEGVRMGREYGSRGDYNSLFAGLNARLSEFNALLGQYGLARLERAARHRNLIAESYRDMLGSLPGLGFQKVLPDDRSSYKDFAIKVDSEAFGLSRDELALALAAENIETRKYYDPPVHRQSAYQQYAPPKRNLTNTDLLASRILCLPIWSDMEIEMASNICLAVERAHRFAQEIKVKLGGEKTAAGSPLVSTSKGHAEGSD
ncbi:MAG: DegT/DnrJ/EryC1/StrS family aminotransferase [Acidobacteriota bacterium]|nr:DegT/DnrJ/EryC1/StrS family aminotransferase [Acidobacteriota bacterium]